MPETLKLTPKQEKHCGRCGCVKPVGDFGPNAARRDGLATYCKPCTKEYQAAKQYDKKRWATKKDDESARNRAYRAQNSERLAPLHREKAARRRKETPWKVNAVNKARKIAQRRAVPGWADHGHMATIYRKAKELSAVLGIDLQVDHVVPIRGRTVCGLHTPDNLQLLAAAENHKKRHYAWPDMP